MTFRGWFALDGSEFANSSRVAAHLGRSAPVSDVSVFGSSDCSLTARQPGLYVIPATAGQVSDGLYAPPPGSRRFGQGLIEVGRCWGLSQLCGCRLEVSYDDSWNGLQDWLGDPWYRPELAPWHDLEAPESAEFGGVWVTRVTGLDATPVERGITEVVAGGGVAGRNRDRTRTLQFEASLVACTSAGLQYGLNWLACRLREATGPGSTLSYLSAHPGHSGVDPDTLLRELHGVVLTQEPQVVESKAGGSRQNQQATIYAVSWEMVACSPYSYLPSQTLEASWDEVQNLPVNWLHHSDCEKPDTCIDMPVLFSADCEPEMIEKVTTPPPVCGGCMPVSGVVNRRWRVPVMESRFRCRETAVSVSILNTGTAPLTLQGYWRLCGTDVRCEDNRFPVQVSGLPTGAQLVLDGVTGRMRVFYDGRFRKPVGIVGTPNGAPWRPPVIDRHLCWDFVVQSAPNSDFDVAVTLHDREP